MGLQTCCNHFSLMIEEFIARWFDGATFNPTCLISLQCGTSAGIIVQMNFFLAFMILRTFWLQWKFKTYNKQVQGICQRGRFILKEKRIARCSKNSWFHCAVDVPSLMTYRGQDIVCFWMFAQKSNDQIRWAEDKTSRLECIWMMVGGWFLGDIGS